MGESRGYVRSCTPPSCVLKECTLAHLEFGPDALFFLSLDPRARRKNTWSYGAFFCCCLSTGIPVPATSSAQPFVYHSRGHSQVAVGLLRKAKRVRSRNFESAEAFFVSALLNLGFLESTAATFIVERLFLPSRTFRTRSAVPAAVSASDPYSILRRRVQSGQTREHLQGSDPTSTIEGRATGAEAVLLISADSSQISKE